MPCEKLQKRIKQLEQENRRLKGEQAIDFPLPKFAFSKNINEYTTEDVNVAKEIRDYVECLDPAEMQCLFLDIYNYSEGIVVNWYQILFSRAYSLFSSHAVTNVYIHTTVKSALLHPSTHFTSTIESGALHIVLPILLTLYVLDINTHTNGHEIILPHTFLSTLKEKVCSININVVIELVKQLTGNGNPTTSLYESNPMNRMSEYHRTEVAKGFDITNIISAVKQEMLYTTEKKKSKTSVLMLLNLSLLDVIRDIVLLSRSTEQDKLQNLVRELAGHATNSNEMHHSDTESFTSLDSDEAEAQAVTLEELKVDNQRLRDVNSDLQSKLTALMQVQHQNQQLLEANERLKNKVGVLKKAMSEGKHRSQGSARDRSDPRVKSTTQSVSSTARSTKSSPLARSIASSAPRCSSEFSISNEYNKL